MTGRRLPFVIAGLVLGVVIAIVFAAQGCGSKHRQHAGGGAPPPTATAAPPGPSGSAAASHAGAAARALHRRSDSQGPFFGFAHGHMTRVDAPRGRRVVALTFDDGPGPQTMQIVRELRHLHARATFFVVGAMAVLRPAVVRAEHHAGMEVGNHTWSHSALPRLRARVQRSEIERTNALLRRLTGRRPRFLRPPDWRLDARAARMIRREGMVGVLRTVDTRDWTLPGVRELIRRALRVRPGGVVAMHDAGGYTRTQTVVAVPHIVRGLRRRHLRLVTIARLYDGR